jgi:hypothetical protein
MKGSSKTIGSAQDIDNLLAEVKAGQVPAADLAEALEALEERAWQKISIVSIDATRKVITVREGFSAEKGTEVLGGGAVKATKRVEAEEEVFVEVTITSALSENEEVLRVPAEMDPYVQIGTTRAHVDEVREVLKNEIA